MRLILVCLFTLALSACNMDWLTGVPAEPCQPEVMREVPVTATDSVRADSLGVPTVLAGYCANR